jgi:hypothetical protein
MDLDSHLKELPLFPALNLTADPGYHIEASSQSFSENIKPQLLSVIKQIKLTFQQTKLLKASRMHRKFGIQQLFAYLQVSIPPKVNSTAGERNRIQDCHTMNGQGKLAIFISKTQGPKSCEKGPGGLRTRSEVQYLKPGSKTAQSSEGCQGDCHLRFVIRVFVDVRKSSMESFRPFLQNRIKEFYAPLPPMD